MKKYRWLSAVLSIGLAIIAGCATPSSPTGGPPDKEGPRIIETEPETGTTNFSGQSIILHFSEFVDRGSLNRALVLEPDIGLTYELDWGRKSVEIQFDRTIPDSTTLITTVDTEFQDVNGNGMSKPYKVAVSTGSEIDDGSLTGRVRNARTGEGEEGDRVLLYREPVNLSEKANYIASTDTSGMFQFSYLAPGRYKAFWVDDRNRNKIWDRKQERAQPFREEFVELAKEETDTLGTVYKIQEDTTQPSLQGVGLFSSQRMRMRFSENIVLTDSTEIAITDTTGGYWANAYPLYIQPNERFVLFAHSEKPLAPSESYNININGVLDSAENTLVGVSQTFTGSSQEDTTSQRIVKRNNLSGYYPDEPVEVTYAKPIEEPEIRDSLKIIEGNEMAENWGTVEVQRNKLRIIPDSLWKDGLDYEIRVWDPAIEDYRKIQPEVWHSSQMGALEVTAQDSTLENIRLRIINEEANISRDTTFSQQVEVSELPPLNYKVIAYHDLNGNGNWDFGEVEPFVPPEPYFMQRNVPVRRDMTGELTITFGN